MFIWLSLNSMPLYRQHGFKKQPNGRYSFGGEMKRNLKIITITI
jgi:hypothetical protein